MSIKSAYNVKFKYKHTHMYVCACLGVCVYNKKGYMKLYNTFYAYLLYIPKI